MRGFVAVVAFCLAGQAAAQADPDLAGKLRQGGYILYLRHTATDFSQNDQNMTSYEDCASQRNLTDAGREQARQIGAQLKRLRIPVGKVLASPFCRTVETAMLAFGRAEKTQQVRGGPAKPDDAERYQPLKKLLSKKVRAKKNLAIASHGNPFYAVFGPPYLAEGETAVVRPIGKDGFELVARIRSEEWARLR